MPDGTPPGQSPEQQSQSEARIEIIQKHMESFFPEYPDMDKDEYDAYDPNEDKVERGQILKFFPEKKRGPEDPQVWFTYLEEKGGFVINYFNTNQIKENPELGYNGDSVAGPGDKRWKDDQIDIALKKARIRYDGIDTTDPKFLELFQSSPPITIDNITMDNVAIEAYRSILADKRLLPPVSLIEEMPNSDKHEYVGPDHPDVQGL